MFWTLAGVALFVGAVITLFPLLRGKSAWQPLALALAFALPAAGLWLYDGFGTPYGIGISGSPVRGANSGTEPHAGQAGEMDAMLTGLRQRLAESPEDLEGWMLLARTLRATQQYAEAADALERAHSLAPENPVVMADLAEAWVYETPDGLVPESSRAMLERALEIDPGLQKGLWLMGVAAMQDGDDAFAISYWQSLLEQLDPSSNVYNMVASQINEAQTRMGMMPDAHTPPVEKGVIAQADPQAEPRGEPAPAADGAWTSTRVVLDAVGQAKQALASGAVLYVMIRTPGPAMGPPLGVRRVMNPTLPLEITLSDEDSMLQERLISSVPEIEVQARVSLSGMPAAQPGDWQSATKPVELARTGLVVLDIDQQVE
ncbi:MAG: tetratricopeptide repeat protein [Gammaproteobacteria bacterium]|nr:tetratricopeptide repeat protein [Gammaproteobacteria bacterium]